jgi:hypothetical protein
MLPASHVLLCKEKAGRACSPARKCLAQPLPELAGKAGDRHQAKFFVGVARQCAARKC